MKRRALISVYRKEGILELAQYLVDSEWEILSTGGTSKHLKDRGLPVTDVSSVTGFPECLDGRVKTLHPAIHAGLLARRDDSSHMETLAALGLGTIDLVCVNLYPFFDKVQAGLSLEETVEFIDIGGPTMLRSAAKNYRDVLVLTDPADYGETIEGLKKGTLSMDFRKRLAGKVFNLTSAYDAAISRYLLEEEYPAYWPLSLKRGQTLRYGENGHQSAALYLSADRPGALGDMEQLQGKDLSYNNIRDLDLAWKAACAFGIPDGFGGNDGIAAVDRAAGGPTVGGPAAGGPTAVNGAVRPMGAEEAESLAGTAASARTINELLPACVAVKHNTPCGVAQGATLLEAYEKAYACDPLSIFGGIVACTVPVDGPTAEKLAELYLEIIIAPDFTPEARSIFAAKKNLRVMKARKAPSDPVECIAVDGGLLVQSADRKLLEKWEVVTKAAPDPADMADLVFGMRAVAFVKSNAIVVVKDRAAVGIGGGQTNRIWAARHALERAAAGIAAQAASAGSVAAAASSTSAAAGSAGTGSSPGPAGSAGALPRVLASDAFFPFSDVVEAAAAAGIKCIVQPGGSMKDKDSIEACDRLGLAMVFTGTRHFKH